MNETAKARRAWADYLAMGPARSLKKLAEAYEAQAEEGGSVPTRRKSQIERWSVSFGWQARLAEIADREAREAAEREAAYRRQILESGYALSHERIRALKELADTLLEELRDPEKRWCRDTKRFGTGENVREEIRERFNASEVEQFRGLLDDIAKELGGRKIGELTIGGTVTHDYGIDDAAAQLIADLIARGIAGAPPEGGGA